MLIFVVTGTVIAKKIEFKKKEFTIYFPELWREIPRDALDEYYNNLVDRLPNVKHKQIDYGFQFSISLDWFDYPYVIIVMHNNGRPSKKDLYKMASIYKPIMNEQVGQRSSLVKKLNVGEMYYDEELNIIWMLLESNVNDVGTISVLSALIPTEKGFIQVACSSLKKDFDKYSQNFNSIILSVKPNQDLVYKPRWTDTLPLFILKINWITVLGKAIDGAIIGAAAVLLIKWKKKKKKQKEIK